VTGRRRTTYGRHRPAIFLLGGPQHQLGCRLGLVRGRTNTVLLGLVLGLLPWLVLWLLALIDGIGDALFSVKAIGGHVRLLVAILLFFVCDTTPRRTPSHEYGTAVRAASDPVGR